MKKLNLTLFNLCIGFLLFGQALDVQIEDYTATPAENFCLQFSVNNFNEIASTQYTIQWDPAVISYDSLTANGLPHPQNLFTNTAFVSMGQFLVNWFDAMGNGNDLPDGSVIYEICFTAIGPIGSSTTIVFSDLPLQIEVTQENGGGENIGLEFTGGTVTIVEPLEIGNVALSQPGCNNPDVGSIELMMMGGVMPYTYNWTGPGSFMADTSEIYNLSSGTYYLTVTDGSDPAIFYIDSFDVDANVNVPVASIADADDINCLFAQVTLDATASSEGPQFEIVWNTVNGNIAAGGNTLNPLVDSPGDYELIITNQDNGCTASQIITVIEDTELPTSEAGDNELIDCNNLPAMLDGSASSSGTNFSVFWSTTDGNIVNGENEYIASVNGSGTYEFTVVNNMNGCTASDEVIVTIDTIAPFVDAGMDQVQLCFDDVILIDGTNSSTGSGFLYNWTTADGNILSSGGPLMLEVDAPGTYNLLITNNTNGCTASDFVIINLDEDLIDAYAGEDENLCEENFQLEANLPPNNTGFWNSLGTAQALDPTSNISEVTLAGGINQFVWTLSTDDCPAYSTDTIMVLLEGVPTASEDMFMVPYGDNPTVLDLVANDGVLIVGGFNIEIISPPAIGNLSELGNGQFEFSYPENYDGMLEFDYELCNEFCPDYCDSTTVYLNIEDLLQIDTTVEIPNAITPNGDGVNDLFVIPILENDPSAFPNNEMIIFNRWGDQLYQSKPYLNNWGGTNGSGKLLPEGTYYYVLRLDLAQGMLIKGEVTILR